MIGPQNLSDDGGFADDFGLLRFGVLWLALLLRHYDTPESSRAGDSCRSRRKDVIVRDDVALELRHGFEVSLPTAMLPGGETLCDIQRHLVHGPCAPERVLDHPEGAQGVNRPCTGLRFDGGD